MIPAPIQTAWHGFRFRSRLEARWAVLLTELAIEFLYEPEGFTLSNGENYLPDFYLPHVRMFAEVKPVEFSHDEKVKCCLLADATKAPCLLLVGQPDFKTYMAVHPIDSEVNDRYETDYLLDIDWHSRKIYEDEKRLFGNCQEYWHGDLPELAFTENYRKAVHLARATRFETERW